MLQAIIREKTRTAIVLLAVAIIIALPGHAQEKKPGQVSQPARKTPLSDSAFIGRVVDREGTASIKPVMHQRWAVADENVPLEPGDWLQTGKRGANALVVRLKGGARLILGPGALAEVIDGAKVRLIRGEMEIAAPEKTAVTLLGPDTKTALNITGVKVFRAKDKEVKALAAEPRWLAGYKNNMSTEAMGSLLANVEGRNVPLTLGYHKVTVDIRDQIARTVVEESFINHTSHVLEGIFYFPLPQDASISGFAMWIGDELVEADIVEKQRAREIYETILREKRDPGLLEWTGGNIFKARVYPIAHEKRIRITYTQVLPKADGCYRYDYSLQSEMLRLHPLKTLQIIVKLYSAEPLASVECPSHPCRIEATEHSASIEFEAQEYTPKSDFELHISTKTLKDNIVLIPHRRADDGYFMLLVNAPEQKQKATRPALPDTSPMKVIVMADTSGSMSGPQRETQTGFIEALLTSLGEKDTFCLMTCDVEPQWASDTFVPATREYIDSALKFLDKRYPLGWSNLEKAFEAVLERTGENTQVIYAGDGIITTCDADPVAFAKKLSRIYRQRGTFHAVATGSAYESVVLKGIASLGGGSTRTIGGGTDPAQAAFGLLKEISSPVVKDLRVMFKGVSVAAVYPEVLPNLPAGMQQIVIGRFDPTDGDQKCTVTVSGTLDGKEVKYSREVTLAGAEKGNSFIPRLWARKHLDHLLDQGRSPEIKNRIITLSEDYNIITPYTSFLVLESDEDRERFKVKRRMRMRDAEEFFAEGREQADYELTRKQMLKAKRWRMQLRSSVLDILSGMNRTLTARLLSQDQGYTIDRDISGAYLAEPMGELRSKNEMKESAGKITITKDIGEKPIIELEEEVEPLAEPEEAVTEKTGELVDEDKPVTALEKEKSLSRREYAPRGTSFDNLSNKKLDSASAVDAYGIGAGRAGAYGKRWGKGRLSSGEELGQSRYGWTRYQDYFRWLFPQPAPQPPQYKPLDWPQDIMNVVTPLNRRTTIAGTEGGFRFDVTAEHKDARDRVSYYSVGHWFLSKNSWLTIGPRTPGRSCTVNWCMDKKRCVLVADWLLGRVREALEEDADGWHSPFSYYFGKTFQAYAGYTPQMKKLDDGRIELALSRPESPDYKLVLLVDPEKSAVVEVRSINKGEVIATTVYGDFVEVGDAWWPKLITSKDKDGRVTSTTKVAVTLLKKEDFEKTVTKLIDDYEKKAIILGSEPADLAKSKQAAKDGKASLEDCWLLLLHFAGSQQWDEAEKHFDSFAKLVSGKWGLNRIRIAYLSAKRRNEELKELLKKLAGELVETPREAEFDCATLLANHARSALGESEKMELLEVIKPVYERQKHILDPVLQWDRQVLWCLQGMNQPDKVFAKQAEIAAKYPYYAYLHRDCAQGLAALGEVDRAISYLADVEKKHAPWNTQEIQTLRQTGSSILYESYRLEDFVKYMEAWLKEQPDSVPYHELDRYFTAHIMLDRVAQADRLAKEWLVSFRKEKLETSEVARLSAAIRYSIGQNYGYYYYERTARHVDLLVETVRYFLNHKNHYNLAQWILTASTFYTTDPGRALQKELYEKLKSEVATLPGEIVERLVQWLRHCYASDRGESEWQEILEKICSRWEKEQPGASKDAFGRAILSHGTRELHLKYYRTVHAAEKDLNQKIALARQLFNMLLDEKWTKELQEELVKLLPEVADMLADRQPVEGDIYYGIGALYSFASWLPRARAQAAVNAIQGVNEIPRRKLREAWLKALKDARRAAAELLAGFEKELEPKELRPWAGIERIYLQVRLGENRKKLRKDAETLLAPIVDAASAKKEEEIEFTERILAARCVATLTHLALDEPEADEARKKLLKTFDEAIKHNNKLLDWQGAKYMLLVALDRADELEKVLQEWYGDKQEFAKVRWGRDYAYILAERGSIDGAVKVFEEIENFDELTYSDYRTLADWYMVQDRKDKHGEARIKSWQTLDEWRLSNLLSNRRYKYQRRGDEVPSELDPEIPVMFIALMRKASSPVNHFWYLRSYYEMTKDFRLLEGLPEAVIGQSAQRIYPFLAQVRPMTDLIWEEATLDRLCKHLVSLHGRAKTDVDRRALRLLEFMVELRAAKQAQGAKPHFEAALKALREASKGEWAAGEPELMAEYLSSQGALQPAELAGEQLRQLSALHANAKLGTYPRFVIGGHYASALWAHKKQDHAIRVLGGAVEEFRQANGSLLPQSANHLLATYCSYLEQAGRFAAAEKVWLDELKLEHNRKQILWLKRNLYSHYHNALDNGAEVSLGRDEELYSAVHGLILAELRERADESHARELVNILCRIWRTCNDKLHFESVGKDLRNFAFGKLPEVLNLYNYRNGQSMVENVAETVHKISGARTALEFLVERAENEPKWLRMRYEDFWYRHGYRVARLRKEIGHVGSTLDERLLAIVLKAIRHQLTTGRSSNTSIYWKHSSYFWSEKAGHFATTAREVLAGNSGSEYVILQAANYMFHGLELFDEGIKALKDAYSKGILGIDGQLRLCDYLHRRNRHAESIPILSKMIKLRPDRLDFRTMLMVAAFHTGDKKLLTKTLEEADKYFHEGERWNEGVMASLGYACLQTKLYEKCVEYYKEAIALHTKTAPNRGVGDGTLSSYYENTAGAYSGLGKTDEAVDAAAGAIVSWGMRYDRRSDKLWILENVLRNAQDLDGYALRLDAEVKKTGLENPIIRKALGKAYFNKNDFDRAALHLRIAVETQPNDVETHRLLVNTYDRLHRPNDATAQLMESAKLSGHDIDLYRDLGNRLASLGRYEESERAFTNIVEMMPNESESHQALAEVRQNQKRWPEAALHWRQVIRVRTNEPGGYMGLARALIKTEKFKEADEVISLVLRRGWPSRFGSVHSQAKQLRLELERAGR